MGLILQIMLIGDEKICKHNIKKKVSYRKGKILTLISVLGNQKLKIFYP